MAKKDLVIRVEGLSKKYLVGHESVSRPRYHSLREEMSRHVRNFGRKAIDMARGRQLLHGDEVEDFWALKDVSFEVERGETIGIIGRNGAGKSTLLKILSRITEPTEGRIEIHGRAASLLEVGTGFHPELTGRDNIYLNGAILGMTKREIRAKFDEIVDFAETERFLDTPVKHFSSGMYVRLAFAVAAHLEPEILIVDEVLAVGDAEFQKKSLGKMREVSGRQGRTVLFVSHNMGSIASLCKSAILLQGGRIEAIGPTNYVIETYSRAAMRGLRVTFTPRPNTPSITRISLDEGALRRGDFSASIEFQSPFPVRRPLGGLVISSPSGVPIWGTNGRFHQSSIGDVLVDSGVLMCEAPGIPLTPSTYSLSAWLSDWHQDFDEKRDALSFEFRLQKEISRRPNRGVIGDMDWPASWRLEQPSWVENVETHDTAL
ncbi:MAG: ABC transporter ATP-binding protein [Terracidiphilus sp.]